MGDTHQRNAGRADGQTRQSTPDLAGLRRIRNPERRIGAVSERLAQIRTLELALTELRDATVRELRGLGWSHGKIATATGLTRARVAQISRANSAASRRL